MKVVFFGSSKFVIPIIKVLQKNFDLKLVLTTENPKASKVDLALQGETLQSWPVVNYCVKNKIPYLCVSNLANPTLASCLLPLASIVAVVADFGLIIPKEILNLFPKGILNIHPSLLPKYRGPTPVQTAILNAESVTGVSIIKLDEEVDHGPIIAQTKEEILATDTADTLYKRLFERGANLLPKVLNKYLEGGLKPIPQNHLKATFTKHLNRHDGYLNISNTTTIVMQIDRMIRAYYPWPGVWFKWKMENGKWKIIKLLPNNLISQYPNDQFLIQVSGKKPTSYTDFTNGYPKIGKEILTQLGIY